MIAAFLLAAAGPVEFRWEGEAVVHAGERTLPIGVRTRIESDGKVVSDSWPLGEGRVRGLRRMVLLPDGAGTLTRNGQTTQLEAAFVREELAQFGFYHQLQVATTQCDAQTQTGPGSNVIEVYSPGPVPTAFRCEWNRVTNAANWVAAEGPRVRQDFRLIGRLRSGPASFPRRLLIKRDGKLFFDLRVTRFSAG